jgi:hypothetical protein
MEAGMRSFICLVVAGVALSTDAVSAAQGNGRGRSQSEDRAVAVTRTTSPAVQVSIVFSPREVTLIRTHYGDRYSNLPPGLKKKVKRGGALPPGWQKKMQPFSAVLERQLVVLGHGHRYGIYDGHAVIYDPLTHAILDIISLF